MNPLLTCSGVRLAWMIRERKVSSREVVEAHIDRIRRINPTTNAVVKERFREALAEADAADERLKAPTPGGLPPFHGVPCTIKESFALTGMPNASGLVARRDFIATEDATSVARLRAAGAIPLGVTNTSELCMWMETYNRLYGRSRNPYDPTRIVGGSSGGEGAIVGAGASPFGLGADIGGSIRMPAFFNGVFGHKPTGGMVPGTGQYPNAHGEALRYLTTGPLARRAEDLMPLLRVLAGPDGRDGGAREFRIGDETSVNPADLNVLHVEGNGLFRVSRELRTTQRRAALNLARRGARVKDVTIPGLRKSFDIWSAMLLDAGGPTFAELLGQGTPIRRAREFVGLFTRQTEHTVPAIVLSLVERLPALLPEQTRRAVAAGRALRRELQDRLGDDGVMLYPSYPKAAPRHNVPLLQPLMFAYTAILNMMEFPVTQVPLGLNDRGLPLGVQVVGAPGNDHLTIAVALELEREFGGWVPPAVS